MAKLRTLTSTSLNALSVATLHKIGTLFTSLTDNFSLKPHPELETCELNARKIPKDRELKEIYDNYKQLFLMSLDNLSANNERDVEVILLAHYLHISHTNEEYTSVLEALCKDIPRCACSSIEYVAKVMLHPNCRNRLAQASMQVSSNLRHSYTYFTRNPQSLSFSSKPLHTPGPDLNSALANSIAEFLTKKYNTAICQIQSQVRDDNWIIEITHGGMRQKEQKEEKAKPVDSVRQPIETDCIIYNTRYKDVRIHMEKGSETAMVSYYQALGDCLFQNVNYWHSAPKYGLDIFGSRKEEVQAMLARGAERLKNPNSGKISLDITSITYTVTKAMYGGVNTSTKHTLNNKQGLNNAADDGEPLVPPYATITHVTLRFCYGLKKAKSLPITISTRKRTLESEVIPGIEDWLKDEHVF